MFLRSLTFLTLFSLPFYVVRLKIFDLPTTVLEMVLLGTVTAWWIKSLSSPKLPSMPVSIKGLQIIPARHKLVFGNVTINKLITLVIGKHRLWRQALAGGRSYYLGASEKLKNCWGSLQPYRFPIIFFLIASIIAVIVSPQTIPALGHWRAFILEPLLFHLVFVNTIQTEKDRRTAIAALGLSLVIPTAVALYQQATGQGIANPFWAAPQTRRITSIYGYPNAYALYAVPITILLLAFMRSVWNRAAHDRALIRRVVFLLPALGGTILALSSIASIFFTRSKGGIAALLIGMAILVMNDFNKKKIIGAFALFTIVAIFFIRQANISGFSTVPGGDSISVRLTQYQETWEMLRDHPLTGAGLRGYQTATVPYHTQKHIEIFMYPHNIFLAVWSELGLLGLIAFLWLLIIFFRQQCNSVAIKPYSHLTIHHATFAAMVAIIVQGLVDVPYFKNDLAVLFWTIIGLLTANIIHRQYNKNMLQ